ncbi:MAG: pyrimidine 5'-nucleotidase [Paracoccaceae bacterium]
MPAARFADAETWIFDLDNTLYPPESGLLGQIDARMIRYIAEELGLSPAEADALRTRYYREHGITLGGLIAHHGVAAEAFLAATHAVDLSVLRPDPALGAAIGQLGGRKIVHTNGPKDYAGEVLARLGLEDRFERVFALEDKGLVPKPDPRAYARVLEEGRIDPGRAVMIEDSARNLRVPKALGMGTVWLAPAPSDSPVPDHVDLRVAALLPLLRDLRVAPAPGRADGGRRGCRPDR